MELLSLLLTASSVASAIGYGANNPLSRNNQAENNVSFVDDFETMDLQQSSHGGFAYLDEKGNEITFSGSSNSSSLGTPTRTYNDPREENDSFQDASCMSPVGYWEGGVYQHSAWLDATITLKRSGWWVWETTWLDVDYFIFDSCCVGTMSAQLTNIPTGKDYDLKVWKMYDGPSVSTSELSFNHPLAQSLNTGNANETISIPVDPGTYFFCVYPKNKEANLSNYDEDNPYHLYVEETVNTSRPNSTYSISQGKLNGDKAAIWVSDYKPLGYTPVTLTDDQARVQINNYDTYPYIRHLADKYTGQTAINYAVIYVWDLTLRACISEMAAELYDLVYENATWQANESKQFSVDFSNASFIVSLAGLAIACIPASAVAAPVVALLTELGIAIATLSTALAEAGLFLAYQAQPTFSTTKTNLLNYLVSVKQTFEVGQGSNENEIKIMRYRYRFDNTSGHYLDWSPFYKSSDYNFYNSDSITWQIEDSGIDGTVHGVQSLADVEAILGEELA